MQNVEIKIDLSALARARETREAEGILYDLSDPFDRALFEAVLEDQLRRYAHHSCKV